VVTVRRAPNLVQRDYVKASNTDAGDHFGAALALDGDTLVVGGNLESSAAPGVDPADQADNSLSQSGAVYVFGRAADGTWSQQAFLKASNPDAEDWFGFAVALSGDTLAVGAPHESSAPDRGPGDNSVTHSGAVYIFARSASGEWRQEAFLKAPVAGVNASFGCSVALEGGTLAVGALQESSAQPGVNPPPGDGVAPASGAAYVFTRAPDGTWAQQAFIKASNPDANDLFGFTLALSGDTLAVGAEGESSSATGVNAPAALQADNSARNSGAVYVFQRSQATWAQQAYIKASNTGTGDVFGTFIALSGDTLAVGAPAEDSGGTGVNPAQGDNAADNSGAVYVFTREAPATWSQKAFLKGWNSVSGDRFGAVALGDNILAVGATGESDTGLNAPMTNHNAPGSGAVYLFERSGDLAAAWEPLIYLKAFNLGEDDAFGFPLALNGDTLAVGATLEDSGSTGVNSGGQTDNSAMDSGAVYIFR